MQKIIAILSICIALIGIGSAVNSFIQKRNINALEERIIHLEEDCQYNAMKVEQLEAWIYDIETQYNELSEQQVVYKPHPSQGLTLSQAQHLDLIITDQNIKTEISDMKEKLERLQRAINRR